MSVSTRPIGPPANRENGWMDVAYVPLMTVINHLSSKYSAKSTVSTRAHRGTNGLGFGATTSVEEKVGST